jgi:RHS repeat-associated protein
MYSPPLGRFLSEDPLIADPTILYDNNWFGERLTVMRNLYGYVGNSPTNYVDPSGLLCQKPEANPCDEICAKARKLPNADKLHGGWTVCGPDGKICGCVLDLTIGNTTFKWDQCPDIQACIQTHENGHVDPNQNAGVCDKCKAGDVCFAADSDPKASQAIKDYHKIQWPKDIECLNTAKKKIADAGNAATDPCHRLAVILIRKIEDATRRNSPEF